jgi:methionine synthase II (cobalamin-independent)
MGAPALAAPRSHRPLRRGCGRCSRLESSTEIARRVEEASRVVPFEDLALSPQCGFASTMEGNVLTEDEQWAKLRLVAETARRVWR